MALNFFILNDSPFNTRFMISSPLLKKDSRQYWLNSL